MKEFHKAKKPMGFLCIAAILPAREFPNVKVTLGKKGNIKKWPHKEAIDHAIEMGADVQPREVDEFLFDKQHFIFTTPAYMYNGTFYQIFEGIGHTIDALYSVMHWLYHITE